MLATSCTWALTATRSLRTCYPRLRPVLEPQGPKTKSYPLNTPLALRSCTELQGRTIPEYIGSPHSKLRSVIWRNPLQNIYVVKKPWNDGVKSAMMQFIDFIHSEYPSLNVIVSEDVGAELQEVYSERIRGHEKHESEMGHEKHGSEMGQAIREIPEKSDIPLNGPNSSQLNQQIDSVERNSDKINRERNGDKINRERNGDKIHTERKTDKINRERNGDKIHTERKTDKINRERNGDKINMKRNSDKINTERAIFGSSRPIIYTGSVAEIVAKTDLIVSLGGDGTTLRAVSAFSNGSVPPVLCFALGTLGFLLPFDFSTFRETFRSVFESRSKAMHRMRLECHVVRQDVDEISSDSRQMEKEQIMEYELAHYKQHHDATMLYAMNDILLHRGSAPSLIKLDIHIDSEFLTTTSADGLVFASPTGSTAYSLSSGGPIVHPLVPCILLTPICPQSLSFRPLVLPATSHVMIKLSSDNRNESVKMTIDGIPQPNLKPGDEIHVVSENGTIYIPGNHQPPKTLRSRHTFDDYIEPGNSAIGSESNVANGIFCIAKGENDWTIGINELLGFNSSFRGKKRSV